jgi:hypothetical protein
MLPPPTRPSDSPAGRKGWPTELFAVAVAGAASLLGVGVGYAIGSSEE